jgi:hypothetical protein
MPDDNIKAVLKHAADDGLFLQALMDDREAALRDVPLDPHERQMLLAVPEGQLRRMVAEAGQRPWHEVSPLVKLGCATAVVATALAVAIPGQLRGITPDVREEHTASYTMRAIAGAEAQYKKDNGRYGSLDELKQRHLQWPENRFLERYVFDITVSGDTFTATARHRERPDTRKAFTVGPDGVVKELPRADEKE